jgi:nicotinate-nucleotide adenylyltransferase
VNTGLALLGGAFNPPHRTHRLIAATALAQLPVAALLVLPAGDHPHKRDGDVVAAPHRFEMCRLLFADLPHTVVDDRELRRPGPSFTVDTLRELRAEQPDRPLWFLIGADNLPLLPTWREHHAILALCTVVTFPRSAHPITAAALRGLDLTAAETAHLLHNTLAMPPDAVAATELRARLRAGVRQLPELTPGVEDYIRHHHLYGT